MSSCVVLDCGSIGAGCRSRNKSGDDEDFIWSNDNTCVEIPMSKI
jgi:hypothetical protein